MSIETEQDLAGLTRIGAIVGRTLRAMAESVRPGMTTAELDAIGAALLRREGARSAPALVYNFPGANCISVNHQIVHGIPGRRVIQPGDLVKVDVTAERDGYIADYSGVRISRTGRRFRIAEAIVWNLLTPDQKPCGQAAMFSSWTFLD